MGAICHDLDHRGFNNKFMIDIKSPLAQVYTSSTMENHHFSMGVSILQQEANSIFDGLNPEEYKEALDVMKKAILATDLALFFPNKARLANIVKENQFDWNISDHRFSVVMNYSNYLNIRNWYWVKYMFGIHFHEPNSVFGKILPFVTSLHRLLAMSLCMTGSDLSSSSKPWPIQRKVSDIVYAEFHEQGDVEKSLGWKPIPLFDSNNFPELASMQVCSTHTFLNAHLF